MAPLRKYWSLCRCGHLESVHDFGRRNGVVVRTKCLHGGPAGPCTCRLFVLGGEEG